MTVMAKGVYWFDDSDKTLEEKLQGAVAHYERKGFIFNRVYIRRPDNKEDAVKIPAQLAGLNIILRGDVLPFHYWLANS